MKKAVFFDIDGTLWDYRNIVPESTKQAIHQLNENGVYTFINTGRSRAFITHPNILTLPLRGIVSACGAMIELDGKVLSNHLVDSEIAKRIVDTCKAHDFKMILEGPEYMYITRYEFENDLYGQKVLRETGDHMLDIDEHYGKWVFNKLSANTADISEASKQECFDSLSDILDMIIHNPLVVEMVPKGFSKGTGILEVCKLLDIDVANTYAFGDSVNDLSMLETAGTAIVMGNGADEAKAAADFITKDLFDDGIYHACKHFDLI